MKGSKGHKDQKKTKTVGKKDYAQVTSTINLGGFIQVREGDEAMAS